MIVDAELHAHRVARKKRGMARIASSDVSFTVPATVQNALRTALALEGIPTTEFNDYLWIIAHESGGAG